MLSSSQIIPVHLGTRSYDIIVQRGSLAHLGLELAARLPNGMDNERLAIIVSSPDVWAIYGASVSQSLVNAGCRVISALLPDGETHKTLETLHLVYAALHAAAADRQTLVVALGGGVIGDIAGFAAATYARGLDLVQVPTTLLAQVDSSVGGKTGVNFETGKNLVGAFHQPCLVVIDPGTLQTLPLRERRSGLAEVIKYGIIADSALFSLLEKEVLGLLDLTSPKLEEVIAKSCAIKASVVEQDEREGGLRAILNFGHTVGHALEALTQYATYTHGEAIALGMVSAALIGEEVSLTHPEDTAKLISLLRSAGFAVRLDTAHPPDAIMDLLAWDKKSVGGAARFVLMEKIGEATPGHTVPAEAIRRALTRQAALS